MSTANEANDSASLRVRRVEIVDDDGTVRAVVGIGTPRADEAVGLWLYDRDGTERVAIALHPTGPSIELVRGGNIAVHIGVSDDVGDVAEARASVILHDARGVPVAGWASTPSGVVRYRSAPEAG